MPGQTRDIEYAADGERMVGFMAVPHGGGSGPAVLVAHEGPGLTDHARDRARRLADLGYVAFALDYHGGGQPIPLDQAQPRLRAWVADPTGIRARAQTALDILRQEPGVDSACVAAIGFCFGGTTSLELARTGADLKAVVGFHPGLNTTRQAESANIKGKVLMLVGAADPIVTPQNRADFEKDMTEAKVDWRLVLYGGVGHSFTNPDADAFRMPGFSYHAATDRRSWRAMLDLLAETIGTP
jgi:dienelactone hydrolase